MGRPGDQSVRCAAGKAVIVSERKQQEIEGGGIRLGDNALRVAPEAVVKFFGKASRILAYDEAVNLLGSEFSPVSIITKEVPEARSYAQSVVSDGSA